MSGEAEADADPPPPASPPLALGEEVLEKLRDAVGETDGESDTLPVALNVRVRVVEPVPQCVCVCEAHWLLLEEIVLLGHRVGEVDGDSVPVRLPLGESETLRVAHTVGV